MTLSTTVVRPKSAFHTLTVADIEPLTDDAVAVTFEVPADLVEAYAFKPGQSLTLRRMIDGRDHRRTYSICAPAGQPPRIGVREVADGLFSHWLVHDLRAGDQIEVQTPTGTFAADPEQIARHVMIAAGSGITPVLSIASSVLATPGTEATLFYGNRKSSSVMFAESLSDLKDSYGSRFDLFHVLSREPRDVELFSGRLDADRLRTLLTMLVPVADIDHFWLCGPFAMTAEAQRVLAELGVPEDCVHVELFYVDEPPPELHHVEAVASGETSNVTIVLDGRSSTTAFPVGSSILDAAQQVRTDLPFACKGGVCGTCRALVVEGNVDMRRNYALEKAEVAEGFVLTCQSFPVSDNVTVDFDR
ncbi:MAG: phenylacetate-CoA oxygenase/reductase subunit PaaK [Kineosporiaceae bacterium]|nr:phenylacetate-CoA oxygenase/reductase subunit PaaK [Aeromicrobium sp.]